MKLAWISYASEEPQVYTLHKLRYRFRTSTLPAYVIAVVTRGRMKRTSLKLFSCHCWREELSVSHARAAAYIPVAYLKQTE